jgi:hypothetical protein
MLGFQFSWFLRSLQLVLALSSLRCSPSRSFAPVIWPNPSQETNMFGSGALQPETEPGMTQQDVVGIRNGESAIDYSRS